MNLWSDIRYGARALRKSPGYALTAILTLAFGIGATTATFSVCDALLWKPVPLAHLNELAILVQRIPDDPNDWRGDAPADVEDIRQRSHAFQDIAWWDDGLANIVGSGGEAERVSQYLVSPNFFEVVGSRPAYGRGFVAGEDQVGRDREVVLSDRLWRRRFGADPKILNQTIRLDDVSYVVVGIMPPKFEFPQTAELWTPLALAPKNRHARDRWMVVATARLKPGRTLSDAAAELDVIGRQLEAEYPATNKNRRYQAMSAHDFLIGSYTHQYTLMLFGAVLFVLLIACGNVANLQLARALGRTREVAVRTALGAGRWRLIRQLVIESVLLSLAGATAGLLVAAWGLDLIRGGMPAEVEKYIVGWKAISLDARTLAFAFGAAILTGILAGLTPALHASHPHLVETLKEGGRGSSAGRGKHRLRGVLVGAEVALSVVLLVGASLMVRGFRTMVHGSTKTEPSTLLTLRLAVTENRYPKPRQQAEFYRQVLEGTAAVPGVRSSVAATALPYSEHSSGRLYDIEGRPAQPGVTYDGPFECVSPNYFATLHIPLLEGRLLSPGDGPDAQHVAVISHRAAERWWPGEAAPIGQRIRVATELITEKGAPWFTIVGVAGDIMYSVWDREPRTVVYVPYVQSPGTWMDIALRTAGDPTRVTHAAMAAIRSVDPEQPISDVAPLDTLMRREAMGLIYVAVMMGIFGALALALSCIGVYGVMAYMVNEQAHEIGIRMALGAPRSSVLKTIFRRGMTPTAAGLLVGLALSYPLARLMSGLIWGVPPGDPATFLGIPAVLLAAAALAIYIPGRRAMGIDPVVALRYE